MDNITKNIDNTVGSSRTERRRMIYCILIYSAFLIAFITYHSIGEQVNEIFKTIVQCSYALVGTVVTAYIAGSSYQDRNYIPPNGRLPQDGDH